MRDLRRYPITLDESILAVEQAAYDYKTRLEQLPLLERPVGDIHALALENAANRLKRLQFAARE